MRFPGWSTVQCHRSEIFIMDAVAFVDAEPPPNAIDPKFEQEETETVQCCVAATKVPGPSTIQCLGVRNSSLIDEMSLGDAEPPANA